MIDDLTNPVLVNSTDFEAEFWSIFWGWCLVYIGLWATVAESRFAHFGESIQQFCCHASGKVYKYFP